MDLRLDGTISLVTAASRGIGRAVAYRLAEEGSVVSISARPTPALEAAVRDAPGGGKSLRGIPADHRDPSATEGLVERVVATHGRLDILVINTPGPPILPVLATQMSHWSDAYEQLLRPALQLATAASRVMLEQKGGSIVFLTSTWVKQPAPGGALSCVMRSAVSALAKQLSIELAAYGVRVNQVLPGATNTDRARTVIAAKAKSNGTSEEEERARALAQIPMARMATPRKWRTPSSFSPHRRPRSPPGQCCRSMAALFAACCNTSASKTRVSHDVKRSHGPVHRAIRPL